MMPVPQAVNIFLPVTLQDSCILQSIKNVLAAAVDIVDVPAPVLFVKPYPHLYRVIPDPPDVAFSDCGYYLHIRIPLQLCALVSVRPVCGYQQIQPRQVSRYYEFLYHGFPFFPPVIRRGDLTMPFQ